MHMRIGLSAAREVEATWSTVRSELAPKRKIRYWNMRMTGLSLIRNPIPLDV